MAGVRGCIIAEKRALDFIVVVIASWIMRVLRKNNIN